MKKNSNVKSILSGFETLTELWTLLRAICNLQFASCLLPIACCLLLPAAASATHLMGGWAGYKYLGLNSVTGNYRYEVTVKVYRYCDDQTFPCGDGNPVCNNTAWLDNSIQLGAYTQDFLNPNNPNKTLYQSFTIYLNGNSSWVPLPGASQCATAPTVCVEEGIYTDVIELPPSNGGYHLFFERCCRNGNIVNLDDPGAEGQSYYAFVPPTFINNSSPTFAQPPVPYICVNDTASILNTAFDPDGDVVVYSSVQPFNGYADPFNPAPAPPNPYIFPIPLVTYAAGYSATQPFGAGGYASVNSFTGISQYLSPAVGYYVVAVELREYRNNQLIGITRMDMQIIVVPCPPNNAPNLSPTTGQTSWIVNQGDNFCFPATFTDPNGDSLFLSSTGAIFANPPTNPTATISPSPNAGNGTVTSQFCWDMACSQTGNYMFIVQVQDNGCPPKVKNVVYTIQVLPYTGPVSISGPAPVCQNSSGTYSVPASGGNSFSWTVSGGTISSVQGTNTINVNWGSAGNGTVDVISYNANGCSAGPITLNVTIQAAPVINAGPNTTFCGGSSVTLTSSGGGTYSWSPSNGLSNPNISNPVANPSVSTGYIVTVTFAIGCSNTDTVNITVNPQPVVNAGNDVSICAGFNSTIGGNPTGPAGSIYNWNPSSGLNSATLANPNASPTITTTYTVVVSDVGTCADTGFVTVTVNQPPVSNAGADITVCPGFMTTLNGNGGGIYNWSSSGWLSNPNISNPVVVASVTTTYTLVVTLNNCTDTDFVSVTIFPFPAVSAGTDVSICIGGNTTLNAGGTGTFVWSPSTGLTCVSCQNPVASPTLTTSYLVTITDANSCTNNDTALITVNPLPVPNAGPKPGWVCPGFSTTLNASNGTIYVWSPSVSLNNPNISNPVASPTVHTTYTVNITDINGCKNRDTLTIFLNPVVPTNAGNDPTICFGQSVTIGGNPTAPSPNTTYQWFPSAGGGLNNSTLANPTASPTITTTYIVAAASDTCNGLDTVTVFVAALPVVSAGADATICFGDSTTLTASGGISYSWSTTATTTSIFLAITSTSTFTVIVTDANGCSNNDSVIVSVAALPVVSAGADISICIGDSTTLTGSGGQIFIWGPGGTLNNPNISNPVATPTTSTSYTVTVTDASGCSNDDSVIVFVAALPLVSAGADISICIGDSAMLTGSGGQIFIWSPGGTLNNPNISNPVATPTTSTSYTVIVTDANGCSNADSVSVYMGIMPIADFGYSLSLGCEGMGALFTDSSRNALAWSWNFGDGASTSSAQNPIHTFPYHSNYVITLTAIHPPCRDTAQRTISLSELSDYVSIQTSNVFTPNNDGMNDCFRLNLNPSAPLGAGFRFEGCADLTIFDRWGVPVYHSEYSGSCWDGRTSAGLIVPEGTYFYIFDLNGIQRKGFITVLR